MGIVHRAIDQDIQKIRALLTEMGRRVQYMLENSIKALIDRDSRLAKEIIQFDREVDELEIQIDQAIYELIALRQPTASDLRQVLADIKINNDLERMGDYCEGICRQVLSLNQAAPLKEVVLFEDLAKNVSEMVGKCIMAYTGNDLKLAKEIILADDVVDQKAHDLFDKLQQSMKESSANLGPGTSLVLIASKLERIADQATNISEEIVFTVTGDNIRHRSVAFAQK